MDEPTGELDRRSFAASLASAAAALAACSAAEAQDKPALKPDAPSKPDAPPKPEAPAKPAAPFNPLALQLELLTGLYPDERLTEEGLRMIAGKLAGQWAHSARLTGFPLVNADGPGFVFSAYRRREES